VAPSTLVPSGTASCFLTMSQTFSTVSFFACWNTYSVKRTYGNIFKTVTRKGHCLVVNKYYFHTLITPSTKVLEDKDF
jgi:hypothetical protein